jgi:hypothetical protein
MSIVEDILNVLSQFSIQKLIVKNWKLMEPDRGHMLAVTHT